MFVFLKKATHQHELCLTLGRFQSCCSDGNELYWVHWGEQLSPGPPPQHYGRALAAKASRHCHYDVTCLQCLIALYREVAILWKIGYFLVSGALGCGLLMPAKARNNSKGKGNIMVLVRSVAILLTV